MTWKLGEYSNNPVEHEAQIGDRREQVTRTVGDYVLTLDRHWRLWTVEHKDGGQVPKGLQGRWSSAADFKARAKQVHGHDYA